MTALLYVIDNGFVQNAIVEKEAFGSSIDLAQHNKFQANMTEKETDSLKSLVSQGKSTDFPPNIPSNVKKIAMELTKLTPTEISHYPITNLSPQDIKSVFELLNPSNIVKVMLNIPQTDLVEIVENKLGITTFNQTLSRLPDANRISDNRKV